MAMAWLYYDFHTMTFLWFTCSPCLMAIQNLIGATISLIRPKLNLMVEGLVNPRRHVIVNAHHSWFSMKQNLKNILSHLPKSHLKRYDLDNDISHLNDISYILLKIYVSISFQLNKIEADRHITVSIDHQCLLRYITANLLFGLCN